MDPTFFDNKLVAIVRTHPLLYNKMLMDFRDVKKKDNTWQLIGKQLQVDAVKTKRRWDNLRETFVRAHTACLRRKLNGIGSTKDAIKFRMFDDMLWLVPFIRKRRSINLSASEIQTKSEHMEEDQQQQQQDFEKTDDSPVSSPVPEPEDRSSDANRFQRFEDTLKKVMDEKRVRKDESNDPNVMFMQSVAEDMKSIPAAKRIKFKCEVMKLLEKYTSGNID